MPSFFPKCGLQPPSCWPCQRGCCLLRPRLCKQSSERRPCSLCAASTDTPAVGHLSLDTSVLTVLLGCLCSPCSSTCWSPGTSLLAEGCTDTWPVHSVLHKLMKHMWTLVLQLFAGCCVFVAFLNGDDFPLSSRKTVYGYGCDRGLCCIIR